MLASLLFHFLFSVPTAHAAEPVVVPENVLYLTFDLDMTPLMKHKLKKGIVKTYFDPALIDLLNKENVQATFFTTGMFAEVYPDTVKLLASNEKFVIENHTYDHAGFSSPCYGLSIVKTKKAKIAEVQKTQEILEKATGKLPTLFRYPGLCRTLSDDKLVESLGLKINNGDVVSGDAFQKKPNVIVKTVLKNAHNGGVVVMHPGGANAPSTVEALRTLIPLLRKEGYVFKQL